MTAPKVFESEYRFCLILWENEPIGSADLARLCKEKLGWSRTTTYTVIRRLSDRGVVINEKAVVRSLVSKEEVQKAEIDELRSRGIEPILYLHQLDLPMGWFEKCGGENWEKVEAGAA